MPKTPSTPIKKTNYTNQNTKQTDHNTKYANHKYKYKKVKVYSRISIYTVLWWGKFLSLYALFCELSYGLKDKVAYQKWQIWGMLTPLCIYGAKSSISKEMNFQMHEYASWLLKDWFFGLEWSDGSAVWGPCRRDCGRTARRFHLTFYWSIYSSTHIGKDGVFGRLY